MDTFAKIKKILEYGSGKAVVLDHEANPAFIVMNWKEYEKMLHTIDVLRGLPRVVGGFSQEQPRENELQQPTHHIPRPSPNQLTLDDLPYKT